MRIPIKNIISYFVLIILLFSSCNSNSQSVDENQAYSKTPVSNLVIAINNQDELRINQIIKEDSKLVNFPKGYNSKYKDYKSLLIWAIENENYESFIMLLNNGADPNFLMSNKKNPLLYAADYLRDGNLRDNRFSVELINYGADVNYIRQGFLTSDKGTVLGTSPLTLACETGNLYLVKLLIENGANPEQLIYTPREGGDFIELNSTLVSALNFKRMDVIRYLIIEKKVNFKKKLGENIGGEKLDINYYLRKLLFLKNTSDYKIKQEIISFVEQKGINYKASDIPKYAVKYAKKYYPENWEQYLKEY